MITIAQAKSIIDALQDEFDSHDFIERLSIDYECQYVEIIKNHADSKNGIFRASHSEIGRFLSEKHSELGIEKKGKESSRNIKGYDSPNQCWRKEI